MDTLPELIEDLGEILDTYHEHVRCDPKQNYRLLSGSLALSAEILTIAEVIIARFELTGWSELFYRPTLLILSHFRAANESAYREREAYTVRSLETKRVYCKA